MRRAHAPVTTGANWLLLAALLLGAAPPVRAAERIDLVPDEMAGWSPSNLFGFLRGPDFYAERTLQVDTTPPGAQLDLFYVRASFQKRYEQATAPVTVVLPPRNEAGKRDTVEIRAVLPGYKLETVKVPVRGAQDTLMIEMSPLDNGLAGVAHSYFAGRSALTLLLRHPASARLKKSEKGFTVILAQTAGQPGADSVLSGIQSPLVSRIEPNQLGEDLLMQVQLASGVSPDALELRSRESTDPVRGLYRFTIDMIPRGGAGEGVARARAALDRIGPGDVGGCAASFDAALRRSLDREQLARALQPRGDFTDPYLRAALRRTGEVSPGGVLQLEDGARYRPGVPLELAAAASQAASVKGYLALLRQWTRLLESDAHRDEALRSLVAPEMEPGEFARALAVAEDAEHRCRGASAKASPAAG